jgi:arsenate reductase-like glutaredoxin family protein
MEINKLKNYLDEGLSLNAIGKKEGKSLGSIRHWMKVHGLKPNFKNFKEEPFNKTKIICDKKLCPKCGEIKPTKDFFSKGKYLQGYCKPCLYAYQAERWKKRKLKAIELMGGKCINCGYCRNYSALEFHHKDPSQKDFDFNTGRRCSWDRLIQELKKCALLCSNCHREEHNPDMTFSGEKTESNPSLNRTLKPTGKCPSCQTNVFGTKFCSHLCAANAQRRAERPSREELEKLLKTTPLLQIGKMHKVSDNAIRKWAKHYGLQY